MTRLRFMPFVTAVLGAALMTGALATRSLAQQGSLPILVTEVPVVVMGAAPSERVAPVSATAGLMAQAAPIAVPVTNYSDLYGIRLPMRSGGSDPGGRSSSFAIAPVGLPDQIPTLDLSR